MKEDRTSEEEALDGVEDVGGGRVAEDKAVAESVAVVVFDQVIDKGRGEGETAANGGKEDVVEAARRLLQELSDENRPVSTVVDYH